MSAFFSIRDYRSVMKTQVVFLLALWWSLKDYHQRDNQAIDIHGWPVINVGYKLGAPNGLWFASARIREPRMAFELNEMLFFNFPFLLRFKVTNEKLGASGATLSKFKHLNLLCRRVNGDGWWHWPVHPDWTSVTRHEWEIQKLFRSLVAESVSIVLAAEHFC